MAKIVEFIGPSGAGKTTTYRELCKKWTPNSTWVPSGKSSFPVRNRKTTIKKLLKYSLFKQNSSFINGKLLKDAREKFFNENPEFMNLVWDSISTKPAYINGRDIRYDSLLCIVKHCGRSQLMKDYDKSKYCVTESGLVHNINLTVNSDTPSEYYEQLDMLINLLSEYANVFINFKIDENTLIERRLKRIKPTFLEEKLTDEQIVHRCRQSIQKKNMCIELLKKKKFLVYDIDASKSVEYNSDKISQILKTLE